MNNKILLPISSLVIFWIRFTLKLTKLHLTLFIKDHQITYFYEQTQISTLINVLAHDSWLQAVIFDTFNFKV